ncbi:MAG: hypothetical protein LBR20_02245 [Propionibacteriaceae bacterium]|jgi:hypothetical protein|nr:hypothetical protein [Propionibacteriaceae bacterium]
MFEDEVHRTPEEERQLRIQDANEVYECALRGEEPIFEGLDDTLREQAEVIALVRAGKPHDDAARRLREALDRYLVDPIHENPEAVIAEQNRRLLAI